MDLFLLRKNLYNSGFTLIETLVAIGIIVFGLISALTMINTSLFYLSNINDRLIATNLVADGIELVRNTRDGNWLRGAVWNMSLGESEYEISCSASPGCEEISIANYGNRFLKLDSATGLYNYNLGSDTLFKRKISIFNVSDNEIRIISTVMWQRKGFNYTSSAEEYLFNWK